jgi:hypothetical protein
MLGTASAVVLLVVVHLPVVEMPETSPDITSLSPTRLVLMTCDA